MTDNYVSVTNAAKMAGVSRATFYRHIDEKGISTTTDDKGNKVVEISELLRVYGDKIKTLEEIEKGAQQAKQSRDTPQDASVGHETEALRQRIEMLEAERERERTQLTGTIEDLRARLEQTEQQRIRSEEQKDRLTLMLTDQSAKSQAADEEKMRMARRIHAAEKAIAEIKEQQTKKPGILGRLLGTQDNHKQTIAS